ncbi:CoA-binding protein [Thauera sp. 2A1]|uniref:CoA-binding protein n=1 Tax=Thauera sp. 2A1 TaxID=2570191 RepID=UPI00129250DC|nr:CoA-binding protein [Thauera sp. 2A1]KAI5912886.1 CoA-binding protein [Thauera sp. 2A1]
MIEDDAGLRRLLQDTRTIAVVGMSANPERASNEVAQYLRRAGYTIIPVNPACAEILGEKCYPSLREVPVPIDLVDVFRKSEDVMPVVEDAIAVGAKAVWLQLGVIATEAAARAEAAGLAVVMDHCTKIEHRRLVLG